MLTVPCIKLCFSCFKTCSQGPACVLSVTLVREGGGQGPKVSAEELSKVVWGEAGHMSTSWRPQGVQSQRQIKGPDGHHRPRHRKETEPRGGTGGPGGSWEQAGKAQTITDDVTLSVPCYFFIWCDPPAWGWCRVSLFQYLAQKIGPVTKHWLQPVGSWRRTWPSALGEGHTLIGQIGVLCLQKLLPTGATLDLLSAQVSTPLRSWQQYCSKSTEPGSSPVQFSFKCWSRLFSHPNGLEPHMIT